MTTVGDISAWNPCATCRCSGTCFARCCPDHDEPCEPGRLCCPACPEQWHPQHPETIDCVRAERPLPPLPARPAPANGHTSTVPPEVQHLADVITDAHLRGIRNGPYTLARTILDAGYRRPTDEPRAAVLTWDWRGQPDLNQLGRVIHDLSGGVLHLRPVDTGSDEYAIVIANTDVDGATARAAYDRWCDDGVDVSA